MKKKITMLFAALAVSFGFNNASAQAVSQGNIIIDAYYGYPNWGRSILGSGTSDVNITGIGPLGGRFEYMVADKFGIGIDFIYNSTNATWTEGGYDYKIFAQRYRPQLRMNYHFVSTDALDAYFGFGAGGNIRNIGYESTEPGYSGENATGALIPISLRIALGMRYYFTDNIGINTEIGLGGPTLSAGLSIKF